MIVFHIKIHNFSLLFVPGLNTFECLKNGVNRKRQGDVYGVQSKRVETLGDGKGWSEWIHKSRFIIDYD